MGISQEIESIDIRRRAKKMESQICNSILKTWKENNQIKLSMYVAKCKLSLGVCKIWTELRNFLKTFGFYVQWVKEPERLRCTKNEVKRRKGPPGWSLDPKEPNTSIPNIFEEMRLCFEIYFKYISNIFEIYLKRWDCALKRGLGSSCGVISRQNGRQVHLERRHCTHSMQQCDML